MLQHWGRGHGVLCPLHLTISIPRGGDRASSEETESTRCICPSISSQPELWFIFVFSPSSSSRWQDRCVQMSACLFLLLLLTFRLWPLLGVRAPALNSGRELCVYEWNPFNRHSALRVGTVGKDLNQAGLAELRGSPVQERAGHCSLASLGSTPSLLLPVVPHYCATRLLFGALREAGCYLSA